MMNKRTHAIRKADLSPDQPLYLEIEEQALLVYQIDQHYQAISATCTHQKFELDGDCVFDDMLICPLHGARYDLRTGNCLRSPATRPLKIYRVIETSETVVIEL